MLRQFTFIILFNTTFSAYSYQCKNPIISAPPEWYEFTQTVDGQQLSGQAFEMAEDILSNDFGKPIVAPLQPWARSISEFRDGEIDILIAFLKNEEREQYASYTIPWRSSNWGVFTLSNSLLKWQDLDSLTTFFGGFERGVILPEPYHSFAVQHEQLIAFKSKETLFQMLIKGRIDYIFDIEESFHLIQQSYPEHQFKLHKKSTIKANLHMAISKNSLCASEIGKVNNAISKWLEKHN